MTLENTSIKSEILNQMWLSGKKQPYNAFETVAQMANTVSILRDSLGITLDTNSVPPYDLMDTTFTNDHLFFCETFGGLHYFFSQDAKNFTLMENGPGCTKLLNVKAYSVRAGYPYVINIYPFEYRPARLWPETYEINVPPGYYISSARVRHEYRHNDSTKILPWHSFDVIDTTGNFILFDDSLPGANCLSEIFYPLAPSDTNLYVHSGMTERTLQFTLTPLDCDTGVFITHDSMAVILFTAEGYACVDSTACSPNPQLIRGSNANTNVKIVNRPNLMVQAAPLNIPAFENRICTQLYITNNLVLEDGIYSTQAAHVFIAVPDTLTLPYLNNWVFYGQDTIYPVGGIIPIDTVFAVDRIVTGLLCASFVNCELENTPFTIYTGWNCASYPDTPFVPDPSLCHVDSFGFDISPQDVNLGNFGKAPLSSGPFSLCDTILVQADFKNTEGGFSYPLFVTLDNIPNALEILNVFIASPCSSSGSNTCPLTYNDSLGYYPIEAWALDSVGISDSALSGGECLQVRVNVIPTCKFESDTLPSISLYAIDYCGNMDTSKATHNNAITIDSSHCSNCFTVEKLVSQSPAFPGDTVEFYIIICGNNSSIQPVVIYEYLPSSFVLTDSLPLWIYVPADTCDTLIVEGYFSSYVDCNDSSSFNKVVVEGNNYLDSAYACIEVISPCINDSTIIFENGGLATSYGSSYSNEHIYLDGIFYVDTNMSFENCIIKTRAGSSIVLLGSNTINFYNTTISGCDTMWQGLIVDYIGTVILEDLNSIQDAHEAINLGPKGNLLMNNSEIINSVTGIKVPPTYPSLFGGTVDLRQARFGMYASSFLPDYHGQPMHDSVLPYAGVDVSDAVLSIGDDSYGTNTFHNMNIGVRGFRSDLNVYNCTFDSIRAIYFYNSKGNASAVVIIGDTANNVASSLRVHPIDPSLKNMDYCQTGVYSFYSNLAVYGCFMDHMFDGVTVYHCKDNLVTGVNGNEINARHHGIYLFDNYGGLYQNFESNRITIDGEKSGVGILAQELKTASSFNCTIVSNQIDVTNGKAGIEMINLDKSTVSYNRINLFPGTISTAPTSNGILVEAGQNNTVSCNDVLGFGDDDTLRNGYKVSQSLGNKLLCNSSDSIGYAYLFEGAGCTGTLFKGNYIGKSYSGLYLNSAAIIGQQPVIQLPLLAYHGNVWEDSSRYSSGFGAVNLNEFPPINLSNSLFTTNQNVSGHNPVIPDSASQGPFYVNDQNWFSPQNSGGHFDCIHNETCQTLLNGGGDEEFRMMVVEDSSVTSIFIEESKLIAQQKVYKELIEDSVLSSSNTRYSDFISDKSVTSIGKLYQVESKLRELAVSDSLLSSTIVNNRSLYQVYVDSLIVLAQLIKTDTSSALRMLKDDLIEEIATLRNTISTSVDQLILKTDSIFLGARNINETIAPAGIPDANEAYINEVHFRYRKEGLAVIIKEYENILQVAVQCPSSGGPVVHKARIFISQVNDSMQYNDGEVCSTIGIFRMSNPNSKNNLEPKLICFPNPASSSLQLLFDGLIGSEYNLEIHDSSGKLIISKKFTSTSGAYYLNTYSLSNGLFHVLVRDSEGINVSSKFIMSR